MKTTNDFIRLLLLVTVLFGALPSKSQTSVPTHLGRMTYEDLLELFNDFEGDTLAQERIARTYLERARRDGDTVKMARGYDRLARVFDPETNLKYADSLIEFTKDWKHITYPAMGFILKGFEFGRLDSITNQYKFMTMALNIAKSNSNVAQTVYLLGEVSKLRLKWGSLKKAHLMLEERHNIILSDNYFNRLKKSTRQGKQNRLDEIRELQLIESYESFVISYIAQKDYAKAEIYLDSVNSLFVTYNGNSKDDIYWWIKDVEVELDFYLGNYHEAINKSEALINFEEFKLQENKYFNTLLFSGLSEFRIGNIEKALLLLNEVERNREVFGSMHNEYLKILFETKLEFYRNRGDLSNQLIYLDKLLEIDSINSEMFKFIEPRMIYEMDAANLLQQKEELIKELNKVHRNDRIGLFLIGTLLLIASLTALFYYRQKVIFKRRFENLINNEKKELNKVKPPVKINLAPSLVADILNRLERFERDKQFLDADITLNSLAKTFQTNSSYLSRVLNSHMEKNFSRYLNGLRVEYALERLKNNNTFRKYTIEAIAYECGYKTSASFSRSFYNITGIYPSYYINGLNKITE